MNQDPTINRLREILWRRPLTGAEEAALRTWLAAHPEAGIEWEAELALSRAVKELPGNAVPSNFTARVLAEVEREAKKAQQARATSARWWWRVFLPRTAIAAAILAVSVAIYQFEEAQRTADLAREASRIASSGPVPAKALEDYATLDILTASVGADDDLLILMK